jgi:ABC-type uncharacterized transport system involved in gliding motility auxiliary subunit
MARKDVAGPLFGFLTLIFCFVSITCLFLKAWLTFAICSVFCLVSFIIFARLRYKEFVNFFLSRQLRYGTNVVLSILGIIGIAVFVNVIVTQRFDKRVDLTELRLHSLSERTKQILGTLDKEVHATTFFTDGHRDAQRVKDMLELYQRETKFFTVSHADPYIDIELVGNNNLIDGTTIFESEGRQEKITIVDEQPFTSALLKLIRDKTKKVYFLFGHQERGIDDFSDSGYNEVKTLLENQNYAPISLSLLTEPNIPSDCDLLVIAGPKTTLKSNEVKLIERYLAQNGKLLLLFDPSITSEDVNNKLVQLMKKWGVAVGNDLVMDLGVFDVVRGPSAPVPRFELHTITRQIPDHLAFPNTRSVTPMEDAKTNLRIKSLVKTVSPIGGSWGETAREPDGKFSSNGYTVDEDTPAPVSMAVAVEREIDGNTEAEVQGSPTRIVVFGGSQFAMNFFFKGANRVLFLATVNWLTEDEDLIAIAQPDLSNQILRRMTVQDARLVQITSVFMIPIIVFIAGMVVWWRRREGGAA